MSSTKVVCSAGWEELRVGDFVIPLRDKYHRERRVEYDGWATREVETQPPDYDAVPCEILGISLPYLALKNVDNQRHFTLDLRRWDLSVCNKEYVKVFLRKDETYITSKGKSLVGNTDSVGGSLCPMCRQKMVSFRPERVEQGYSNWSLRCKKCKIECREYR